MPRLLKWRAVSGPPFFSSKRALCPPGVAGNKDYVITRWGKQDGGCVPSNVRPEVVEIRAYREAVSMLRRTGRKSCRAEEIARQNVYDPSGTFQIASIKDTFGTHVQNTETRIVNIGRSGRTTRPESARREKLGTLVSDPSLTGHNRGAGVGRGPLNGCVMRCAVATSPSRGPRGPFRTAFRLLPEATVADAMGWTRRRRALKAGWRRNQLGQCGWSDARNLVRSSNQSHDLFA